MARALSSLLDLLAVFLTAFFGDFFVDLLAFFDLLEDLERADALAINEFEVMDPDNLVERSGDAHLRNQTIELAASFTSSRS